MTEEIKKTDEEIARERVEQSPLRFLTIGRYSGNHSNLTSNSLPKPQGANFHQKYGNQGDYEQYTETYGKQ